MRLRGFLFVFALFFLGSACERKSIGIARVGPFVITEAEFDRKKVEVAPQFHDYLKTTLGRRQFLDIIIREKLKLAAAQDSNAAGSKEIQEGLRQLRERQELEIRKFREYRLVELWEEGLRTRGILGVSDEQVSQFLKDHPRETILRHILVGNPNEAQKIYKRAKKGESFSALAKAHSLDPETASRGGLLPSFLYGEVMPELSDVAFRMKTGEVNGVIRSKFGYHVLKKEKSTRVSSKNKSIRARVKDLIEKRQFDEYLAGLEDRYHVEVYDEKFQ